MEKSRLVKFFETAGAIWGTSVIASLLLLGIGAVEHVRDHNISGWAFLSAGVGLFMFACYKTWSLEHDKLLQEQAKNASPQLKIEVVELVRTNLLSDTGFTYCAHLFVSNTSTARTTIRRVIMRSHGDSKEYLASPLKKVRLTRHVEVPAPRGI